MDEQSLVQELNEEEVGMTVKKTAKPRKTQAQIREEKRLAFIETLRNKHKPDKIDTWEVSSYTDYGSNKFKQIIKGRYEDVLNFAIEKKGFLYCENYARVMNWYAGEIKPLHFIDLTDPEYFRKAEAARQRAEELKQKQKEIQDELKAVTEELRDLV